MKNALLINVSEIGDIVSSTIVADALIQNGFDVDFLMPEFVHTLFQHEETITLWSPENIPTQKYALIIDLTSNKASRRIVRKVKGQRKIGRIKGLWQKCRHWITYSRMVLKQLDGHIVRDYYPILHELNDEQRRKPHLASDYKLPKKLELPDDANIVSIHFGANNPKRLIPMELLTHAIQWLHGSGYKIVLLGTEKSIGHELVTINHGIPLFKDLSLGEVRSVLSCSKLFIGADSGILHIAAAIGCPSIGIYGPNVPERAGPLSPAVSFFEQSLSCRPCNQSVECPWNIRCMNTLDKATFLELIKAKLGGGVAHAAFKNDRVRWE